MIEQMSHCMGRKTHESRLLLYARLFSVLYVHCIDIAIVHISFVTVDCFGS